MRMPKVLRTSAIICLLLFACRISHGQSRDAQPGAAPAPAKDFSNSPIVTRMMAFDKKHDGKLTKDEVTDERLHSLFDRADANHDGIVTKEELMALAAKLDSEDQQAGGDNGPGGRGGPGGFGGPGRGPGGFGGPGGRGRAGRGGGGAFGGPPRPGQILPPMLQDTLNLTPEQRSQLADLQKDVDAKLAKILTDDQRQQLNQMAARGRRGRGGFGGPNGPPDGPAGNPPPPPPPPQRDPAQ